MFSSFRDVIKDVFSKKNILGIAITSSMWSLGNMGWRPFWSLYIKNELGASITVLGMLSMIQTSQSLLFQLPGGIIADRWGRRKIIVYGTSLRIIPPIIYLMATSWVHVIPAIIINGMASIYMPAFNAIIADSLPKTERGAGYGAYRMITSSPMALSPFIGGVVMDAFGYKEGVRIFLMISLLISIVITIVRWRVITETLVKESQPKRGIRSSFAVTLGGLPRTIKVMMVVAVLGSFGMRMVMQFLPIYAVEIIGITNTQLGVVQTVGGLISTVLAMPGGMLSDSLGRKPMILISRIIGPLATYGVSLAGNFQHYFIIRCTGRVGEALGGGALGFAGGPAWRALIADLIPPERRGTVMGTMGTLTGIVGAPSSLLGGYLWHIYSPQLPFQVSMALGLIGAAIFALGVKEPKRQSAAVSP